MSSCRFAALSSVLLSMGVAVGCSVRHAPNEQTPAVSQPAFAEKRYVSGVSDFGKVNDFLYRGAQPKDGGVEQLKKIGINTIVDLRSELHGLIANERQRAESLGLRYVNLPGSGWSTAKDEQIAQFFSLVRERPRRRIFIHCWLGGDRSGMFIAAYRIAFEGWTPEQAIQEMRSFHYLHFWHPNMARWVKAFPDRLARSPTLAPFCQCELLPRSTREPR